MQDATPNQLAEQHATRLAEWRQQQAVMLPVADRDTSIMKSLLMDSLAGVRSLPGLDVRKDVQVNRHLA